MSCQDIETLLGVVDALPDEDAKSVRQHLKDCAPCRARAEAMGRALERIAAQGAALKAPKDKAWARIAAAIEAEMPAEALPPRSRRRSRVSRPRRVAMLLATGALLLCVSLFAALKLTVPVERELSATELIKMLEGKKGDKLGLPLRVALGESVVDQRRRIVSLLNATNGALTRLQQAQVSQEDYRGDLGELQALQSELNRKARELSNNDPAETPLPFLKVARGPGLFDDDGRVTDSTARGLRVPGLSPSSVRDQFGVVDESLTKEVDALWGALPEKLRLGLEPADGPDRPKLQRLNDRLKLLEDSLGAEGEEKRKVLLLKARVEAAMAKDKDSWKPSPVLANSLRLMVGDKKELPLKGLQVQVRIDAFRARVLLDAFFENPDDQRYEGSFKLRLPDGASPHFLAFGETVLKTSEPKDLAGAFLPEVQDFDGAEILEKRSENWPEPKVARMVPREKAASAYKATVRQRVDPALLEWSGAGVFQARVFPLMPKKTHRIVIAYDLDLRADGQDLALKLDLPAAPARIVDVDLARIPGVEASVEPKADETRGRGLRFKGHEAGSVTLRLKKPGPVLLTGADRAGPRFVARVRPHLPQSPIASRDRAVVLLDTSYSARYRFAQDIALMKRLLTENRDQIKEFAVLFFNVERFWFREAFTPNAEENVDQLIDFANRLVLEGATDLGRAIDEATKPSWTKTLGEAELFLLSDGAANWGASDLGAMRACLGRPGVGALFAYRSSTVGTDAAALTALAQEKGGALFAAVSEGDRARAARAHRSRPWILEKVRLAGGEDLLVAGRPQALFPGQELTVVGRGIPSEKATLRLTLRQEDKERVITIPFRHRVKSALASRAYGQVAVAQLEGAPGADEKASENYALHYRVTGKRCSLLMLESEADYQRHNIQKPELLAEAISAEAIASELDGFYRRPAAARDAKAAFMAFIARLKGMPEMSFDLADAAYAVLADLGVEAFEVKPEELRCLLRERDKLGAKHRATLSADSLDYGRVLDEAQERFERNNPADALRALSSLVEDRAGEGNTRRDVAQTLLAWGRFGHAYHLLRRQAEARPFEPLPYLLMASGAAESGRLALAMAWYEVIVAGEWDGRFGDFKTIAIRDYARVLDQIVRSPADESLRRFAELRLRDLGGRGEADLVVQLSWATDSTDVDLHVTEPSGEEVYYEHRESKAGAGLSADVTQGYGPEVYRIEKALAGAYQVDAVYYNDNSNRSGTRSRVLVTIIRDWGRPSERVSRKVVTLSQGKERLRLSSVLVK